MKARIMMATLLACLYAGNAAAAGALAIDTNQGDQYGFSYDFSSMGAATDRALGECGSGCSVVLRFSSGCAAYATDQSSGSTVYGWGTASSRGSARSRAISECQSQGGMSCQVRVWGCNSQ